NARDEKHAGGDHGGSMDQRANWRRTFHRVRQPDVQRELSGLANCTAKNQKRDKSCACTKQGQTGGFETPAPAIVEKQCTTAVVEAEHPEEKSHVADPRGDECLLCGRRGTWPLDPKTDEQIRREPYEFPKHEKQQQTVCNNHTEHRAGEER